ncbi:MAG: hypothetical protein HUK02_00820 [Bacteroidaceae bacterium]|nr:hypothetical protein [Bacteroidaceae bacterium]
MKKILSLLLFVTATLCQAQTLQTLADRLQKFGASIPQEEVFVHTDNTCYYLGDTICYKAYMRLSDGRPSSLSRLLYVELLNQDGYLVERQKVEMKNGQGHGTFCLPDTLYAGYYELRAYTRWQLNWGATEHPHTKFAEAWFYSKEMAKDYYRDYEKLYSRVFPIYSKPQQEGNYNQLMNLRPIRRYSQRGNPDREATVQFFPEGGTLVAGTQCRVAYEARNADGEHLKGTLRVTDSNGNTVAESEVKHRGRGDFLLDCKPGERYSAEFAWRDGHSQRYKLPQVEADGVALQAKATDEGIALTWQTAGQAAQEELGLTVSIHGVQKHFAALPAGTTTAFVPMDQLESGVAQVTLFNAAGRIWADRLVFVRKGDLKASNVIIKGLQTADYQPYSPIRFSLQGTPGATLSVAVRDNATSDRIFDTGTMLTEMLLCSQLKGFVEAPEYYFESADDFHRYALDLLLLVQGWRRYSWHEMAMPGAFQLTHPYERSEVFVGSVNRYTANLPEDVFTEANRQMMNDAGMTPEAEEAAARAGTTVTNDFHDATGVNQSTDDPHIATTETDMSVADMGSNGGQVSMEANVMQIDTAAPRTDYRIASERFYDNEGKLKRQVRVHAEFTQPGAPKNNAVLGDVTTTDGKFRIDAPNFNHACFFFLGASDTTTWKKGKAPEWVKMGYDKNDQVEWPDFYVRLNLHYPRFVKRYDFYQQNIPYTDYVNGLSAETVSNAIVMKQVLVGANRGGLLSFDKRYPAFVLDAYEAFNATIDAGLCPGYFIGSQRFSFDVARNYIGDMGMERPYLLETRIDSRNSYSSISMADQNNYNKLFNLDMVYVYTDYAPRLEGDPRYSQSNQPFVVVDLRRIPNSGMRPTWTNRHMLLTGYAVCEDVYQPDYSNLPIGAKPTDHRRTLYWNPDLQLDASGQAEVNCYNNGHTTAVIVSAEGMATDGQPQSGISYPERR